MYAGRHETSPGLPEACGADGRVRMQLRVGLAFVHPPSATEADFLFPEGGGARRKRKHGSDAVQPGRALLRTMPLLSNGQQAARMRAAPAPVSVCSRTTMLCLLSTMPLLCMVASHHLHWSPLAGRIAVPGNRVQGA